MEPGRGGEGKKSAKLGDVKDEKVWDKHVNLIYDKEFTWDVCILKSLCKFLVKQMWKSFLKIS